MEESKSMVLTKGDQLVINGILFHIEYCDKKILIIVPLSVTDKLESNRGESVDVRKRSFQLQPNDNQ